MHQWNTDEYVDGVDGNPHERRAGGPIPVCQDEGSWKEDHDHDEVLVYRELCPTIGQLKVVRKPHEHVQDGPDGHQCQESSTSVNDGRIPRPCKQHVRRKDNNDRPCRYQQYRHNLAPFVVEGTERSELSELDQLAELREEGRGDRPRDEAECRRQRRGHRSVPELGKGMIRLTSNLGTWVRIRASMVTSRCRQRISRRFVRRRS